MNSFSLYSVAQIRRLEQYAIGQYGVSGFSLMQRAASSALHHLRQRWPDARHLVLLCGTGNNGGDGFLLGQQALQAGLSVQAIVLSGQVSSPDAEQARAAFLAAGGQITQAPIDSVLPKADVYIDALFGIGLTRPIAGSAAKLIEQLNASNQSVLALDIPSGLNADTGQCLGPAVRADTTLSFIAHKLGLHTAAALDCRGELLLDRLGLPDELYCRESSDAHLLDAREFALWLPPRLRNVHKGNFGHVLTIGGDYGMGGAIRLAAEACLRTGAGLVSVATRSEHIAALNTGRPELMAQGVLGPQDLTPLVARATTIAIGPGLGMGAWGHALWQIALASNKPMLLDADALNLLALEPRIFKTPTVLTPHPAEAARLLNCTSAEIQQDRYSAARAIAARYQASVLLKGAGTLIASPQDEVRVCPWGNPGMASAGMGDVLSGVIAGLLAQGLTPWFAAQLGVALHAQAGDRAAATMGERGLIASDLMSPLHLLVNSLADHD